MMLRILAPRLAPNIPIGPSAPTLTGDLERSFRAIESGPARTRVAPVAVALVAGALLGVGGQALVHRSSQAEKHADDLASASGSGAEAPAVVRSTQLPVALDASPTPLDAAIVINTPDASPTPTLTADGSASVAKHPIAPLAGSAVPPAHGEHVRVHAESQAPVATVGTLIIKVTPNADVYVDNAFVGSAPVKKLLSNGVHHVRLVGNGKEEETDVTVSPTKDVVLTRNW
jgi:PEGA domain